MTKRIFLTIAILVIIKFTIKCQDLKINSNTLHFIDNKEVLFTQSGVNPTLLTDSVRLYFDFLKYKDKEYNSNGGFYLYGETALKNHGLSLGFLFNSDNLGIVDKHYLTGSIKKKIPLGINSSLNIATNIGVWRMRYDMFDYLLNDIGDPMFLVKTDWSYVPVLDVGFSYNYKNQTLGISFKNINNSNFKFFSEEYESGENGMIINYQGIYNTINKISLIPEIYGCFSEDDKYAIAVCRIKYSNLLSVGLLYNSNDSYGFSISGILFKRIKLGYYRDFEIKESWNDEKLSNHGINLGIILL